MRESLLEYLVCPRDQGVLALTATETAEDGHVLTGELACDKCARRYPLRRGVPNMIPTDGLVVDDENLHQLQRDTISRFGFEWRYFNNWGWLDEYPAVKDAELKFKGGLKRETESSFRVKSLFEAGDLQPGMLVLDGGCGNGRYAYEASRSGAQVIGVDLGLGVFSAFENTRQLENVHIVQGDLFRLPFRPEMFDRIFSIGVLMHTGNAGRAYDSLTRTLKPGGKFVAHVYGRGLWLYEMIEGLIRAIVTRLPIRLQLHFARLMARIALFLSRPGLRKRIFDRLYAYIQLIPTEHHMFDWWSAPIATHHTHEELQEWLARNKLKIIRTNPDYRDAAAEKLRRKYHSPITYLGQKCAE